MRQALPSSLMMLGVMLSLLVIAAVAFVRFDGDGARGAVVGAALGLVNLILGYRATRRTLQRGMTSAMATLATGAVTRLLVVAGLVIFFQRTGAADPAAFALTFMAFFFVYLVVEVLMVERSLSKPGRAA
jgi:F0F1-type ATP synthase assembly protein I